MIFPNVKDWKEIEIVLRELGFTRQKLLVVHELWYRLQFKELIKELTPEELEEALEIVAEAYDELPE